MKGFLRFISVVLCIMMLSGVCLAQDKVSFIVSGKKQGTVASLKKDNTTYVDLQKTARKLGFSVELFARSKQAKITARGFYAILTAGLAEYILNAQTAQLSAPVLINGGAMFVPAEFFLLPQVQKATGKEIAFAENTFQLESPYDMARESNELLATENRLVFVPRRQLTWSCESPNAHTVDVTFPNAAAKREENLRLKTDFIASVSIRQDRSDTKMRVILGKQAKHWTVEENGGKIYFRVAGQKLTPLRAAQQPSATTAPATVQAAQTTTEPATPSVGGEKDDFEEMFVSAPAATVGAVTASGPAVSAAKTTPVMTAGPAAAISSARKKMRIVVDPGHGGKDPGALRSRVREKDLNLAVAKELYKLLKKGNFEVKITRDNDTFIALSERSKIANNFKADLFVSVHTNSSKNRSANGFEVYFRSEKATDKEAAETAALENEAMQYEEVHYNFVDALLQSLAKNEYINESSKLAGYVRNEVYKQPGIGIGVNKNSSVRQANFYVLKGVQSPAILVEMGYISSNKDRGRLTQGGVQKKMAQGIYNGIYNYAKNEGWLN